MKTLEQVESDVRRLPPEKQEELRDWLENLLEDQLAQRQLFFTMVKNNCRWAVAAYLHSWHDDAWDEQMT
ncbi:MAG: hypothetical protein ABSA47_07255 [Verrucomicrobiota bacterium]